MLVSTAALNAFSLVLTVVVFVLLVATMTTAGYYHSSGWYFSSELPIAVHPITVGALAWGANRDDAMIVDVARSGDVFMNDDRLWSHSLAAKIRQSVASGAEPRLYIRAHPIAPYSSIKAVLNAAQIAGVKNVSFLVYQRKLQQ